MVAVTQREISARSVSIREMHHVCIKRSHRAAVGGLVLEIMPHVL